MRIFSLISLLLVALITTSCATKIEGLRHDPSFTAKALYSDRMAVGGVVSSLRELAEPEAVGYSTLVAIGFLEERPGIPMLPAGTVRVAMGDERHSQMLADYRRLGLVTPDWLAEVRQAAPSLNYLVMVTILENRSSYNRTRSDIMEKPDDKKDSKKVKVGEEVVARATRRMMVALSIYDLLLGQEVWGGAVTKTGSAEKKYQERLDESDVAKVITVVSKIMNKQIDLYPYPPVPTAAQTLRSIFYGFAENLPELK